LLFLGGSAEEAMMKRGYLLLLLVPLRILGCRGADIGEPCEVASCAGEAPPEGANVFCEPSAVCQELVCVSQNDQGFGQFCTADCEIGREGECPSGFSCQLFTSLGGAARNLCLRER
jgi:hypothetical protein